MESQKQCTKMNKDVELLWNKYFDNRSITNRNKLVVHYAPYVSQIVKKLKIKSSSFWDDHQNGIIGLISAIEGSDKDKVNSIHTYLYVRIRGAILDGIKLFEKTRTKDKYNITLYSLNESEASEDLQYIDLLISHYETPDTQYFEKEKMELLYNEINKLDEHLQITSYLILQDLSHSKIGEVLGISGTAVYLRKERIKKILSETLDEKIYF